MVFPVHVDTSAYQCRVGAVPPTPQRIANHDHSLFSQLLLVCGKPAPSRNRNSQEREEVRRYARAAEPLRLTRARENAFPGRQGAHGREGRICLTPFLVDLDRDRQACELAAALRYNDLDTVDLLRLNIRAVSYTHLRAHETRHDLVCRLL